MQDPSTTPPERISPQNSSNASELHLQRELRSMFDTDTKKYLQSYLSTVEQLQASSWVRDIQELYRAIHTIKGGAVTVGADAVLHVAAALEEILSELRYVDRVPSFADGQLQQVLLEGGELLASSLQVAPEKRGEAALHAVQPTLERLQAIREHIQQTFLPEWNEWKQLQHEFAEQGFDLVVLDIEMAVEQLPEQGQVPAETVALAKQTLRQLRQIGQDLQFDADWLRLLIGSKAFLTRLDNGFWKKHWPAYLKLLKSAARRGGKRQSRPTQIKSPERQPTQENSARVATDATSNSKSAHSGPSHPVPVNHTESPKPNAAARPVARSNPRDRALDNIQISIPLARLERSAESVVEILLAARASQSTYQTLQQQLVKLVELAQDGVQYITRLRQIQDDYALSEHIEAKERQPGRGPIPERYRQGYATINRLLETSLRLSELGAEAEKTALQTAESLQQLDSKLTSLQRTVEASRLVSFKTIGFQAKAILRDLNNRYGKEARLLVSGEELELDVGTARTLEPALLHLIRNAYDHGLESPEERIANNKPNSGTLSLSLQRWGDLYLLELSDDGRGIDIQAVEERARQLGLLERPISTNEELLNLLCQPGFSSRDNANELSGRGVGMDVVADCVARLGGQLTLETALGVGTTLRIQFPVPHLLVSCILLRAGNFTFAIPTEDAIATTLFERLQVTRLVDSKHSLAWSVQAETGTTPGFDLLELWQPNLPTRQLPDTAICVCLRFPNPPQNQAWLFADELIEQSDLAIEALPSPLVSPPGLLGVSLQPDGSLIPVIEVSNFAAWILEQNSQGHRREDNRGPLALQVTADTHTEGTPETNWSHKTILVVDDAALMRRRIEASLTANGYTVHTFADGLEAWNWLQLHPRPSLLITDIEMPGLDGFTLIDRCRSAKLTMPILVISSRLAEEWGQEAQRLGATAYLTKGFSTPELINKVHALIQ